MCVTVSSGQCVMLCVRQAMGGRVTLCVDLVYGVINSFAVHGQCKEMHTLRSAEVALFLTC